MVSYGLFGCVSWNIYEFGDRYIIQGRFDRVLLRPASTYLQVVFESFRIPALSESLIGGGIVAWSLHRLDVALSAVDLLFGAGTILSGAVIFTAVFSSIASLSFHFEDRVGVAPPVFNMIAFGRYRRASFRRCCGSCCAG